MTYCSDSAKCVLAGMGYWGKIMLPYIKDAGFNVSVYSRNGGVSFADYLREENADTVFLCTPVSTHFDLAKEALSAGCNVFCEKMLTADADKARELYDVAEKQGRVLFTDYIYLYSPSIQKLKESIGDIGPISLIQGDISQFGKFYEDADVIANIGVHMISSAGYLTDFSAPSNINITGYAQTGGLLADTMLTWESKGVNVCIHSSLLSAQKIRKIRLLGQRGELLFDMTGEKTFIRSLFNYDPDLPLSVDTESFSFDEANNIANSIKAFKKAMAEPDGDGYIQNKQCCLFTEQLYDIVKRSEIFS